MRTLTAVLIVAFLHSTLSCSPLRAAPAAPEADAALDNMMKRYPNARFYRVTLEEYRRVKPLLDEEWRQGRLVVAELVQAASGESIDPASDAFPGRAAGSAVPVGSHTNAIGTATNELPATAATHDAPALIQPPPLDEFSPPARRLTAAPVRADESATRTCNGFVDLVGDIGSGDWGDSDFAVVLFVVIGVTVVLAVVIYATAFLYDAVAGHGHCTYWWDIGGQSTALIGGGDRGYIAGAKLSSGFDNREARVGVVLEGGYMDTKIRPQEESDRLDIKGSYFMAGAGVRWPFGGAEGNASLVGIELLAGTASDEEVGLMSAARAQVIFGVGSRIRLGFSIGTLYLDLEPEAGPIREIDNYTALLGMEAGLRL